MNRTVKWCLLSLVASAAMFGTARAQEDDPVSSEAVGTVQLGPKGQAPVQAMTPTPAYSPPQGGMASDMTAPPGVTSFPLPPAGAAPGTGQAPSGSYGSYFGITRIDQVFQPRFNVDSRGGGLYGYGSGYSNVGMFVPYQIDESSILFGSAQALITYDGRGGASLGSGWRYWAQDLDRIIGLSAWFDFDNGHAQPYQQVGFSFESLGRYLDYRANGYLPVSNPDHVLSSTLTSTSLLMGNGIGLARINTVEQAFAGFDAEVGGPTPILGRYGLNAYIGGYNFSGMGVNGGNFTGVSGRLLSQINEDLSFGVQVTNDHMFGLNTQFQVFCNLPNGKSSRWLRNLRVRDRLVAGVFRQNRVIAKTETFTTYDAAINPETNKPYFVANIDPNLTTNGNGSASSPFDSIAAYEAAPLAQRQQYDIIFVQPRTDATSTNLNTSSVSAPTLELFNGQHLLGSTVEHGILTANLPGVTIDLPLIGGSAAPILVNSAGNDIITLAPGNTRGMEVSGFNIMGNATGTLGSAGYVASTQNGIVGSNIQNLSINNNEIQDTLNAVKLNNLSGTLAAGTEALFVNNNIHDNSNNGIQVTNNAAAQLDVVVQGNTFNANGNDGLQLNAQAGSVIGGIIGGPNTAATAATSTTPAVAAVTRTNTFSNNLGNGLNLTANGGTLNFLAVAPPAPTPTSTPIVTLFGVPDNEFGIYNNAFTGNTLDGLHIQTTNNSLASFTIQNNSFGTASVATSGNLRYGIGLIADSGTTTMNIGGNIVTNADGTTTDPGNTFNFNTSAINLAVTGSALLNYNIQNNLITNGTSATVAAPHDEFTFSFNGTSGTNPFVLTNLSDPGVSITNVTWNLAGTAATIAPTTALTGTNPVVVQPISDSLLTSVNGQTVTAGSSPLLITATGLAADNANTGLASGSQVLPLGFTSFVPSTTTAPLSFSATSLFEQAGGSAALTSASTIGSTLTVTFSNGLTSTEKVAAAATGGGVSAEGDVFGTATPGFGTGNDGIHITAGGSSTLNSSIIQNNTITGYGNYGVEVATSGNATASHVIIENNTIQNNGTGVSGAGLNVFTGGAVNISRNDSSTLAVLLEMNSITQNFNTGVAISSSGTTTGGLTVTSRDNNISNNAGNGLTVSTSTAGILTYTSNQDDFNGNGGGSAKNPVTTGGDNIALFTAGTSVANVNFTDVLANNANGSGLSATTNDSSTLNLLVNTVANSTFTGDSTFSTNKANGVLLTSNSTSFMHANFYNTIMSNNATNGASFVRNGASLVRSTITDSNLSNNGVNGLAFHGLGSDPQDPTQPSSGSPNVISLVRDSLNFNGNFTTAAGQGARIDLFGDSDLVLNATATTFNNNAENGIRVEMTPGAQFGYQLGNQRSTLDNVDINNNGLNGILITTDVTVAAVGNGILPYNAPSVTYMQISSNTGDTTINDNGANGILLQYPGGTHNILITGDTNPATNFGTFIQGNKLNGISSITGVESNPTVAAGSGVVLTVDGVIIGGTTAADANGGSGIDFETQSEFTVDNAATGPFTWAFNGAGFATLNVNNSLIEGNGVDGITLTGNNLDATATAAGRFENGSGDASGALSANISNSMIIKNKGTGININLIGQMGDTFDSTQARGVDENNFVITNNVISSNGAYGVFFQQNAAVNIRSPGSANPDFVVVSFNDPQPTNPAGPFDPNNLAASHPNLDFNTSENTNLIDTPEMSNWMWLGTALNSSLVMTGNQIQYNGTQANLSTGDGVFLRVGTNSYLSADIQGNTMSGNLQNDFHVESFLSYNPVTGIAPQPTGSAAVAAPGLDTVVLDDTAQLDLRFINNTGNTVNIGDPLSNFSANGSLDPTTSPNGAVYAADPLKDNFSFTNPSPRIVQLFQVDNGLNLNSTNSFTQNGVTADLENDFFNADWNLRSLADPSFPNSAFPQPFSANPGNPFLP